MDYIEKEISRQNEIINSLKELIEKTKRENAILELNNVKKEIEIYEILSADE